MLFFDRIKLDDPVGASACTWSCGVFGTICVGLFATDGGLFLGGGFARTAIQSAGIAAVGAATFVLSMAAWIILKVTIGIRVSAEEEVEGLDVGEHGMEAYSGLGATEDERRDRLTSD